MQFTYALHISLDDTPNNRKLSKEEKAIANSSVLTTHKPKPALLRTDNDASWYMPLNLDLSVEAHFIKARYPTQAEIVEIELKARELFPCKFTQSQSL
jgi:hypothetical protein